MLQISLDNCPIENIRLEKNFTNYSVSVKVGGYYEFDYTKVSNEIHRHDCHELVFVLDGRGEFLYEGRSVVLHQGGIFMAEPYKTHEIHIRPNENLVLIYFMIRISRRGMGKPGSYEEQIVDFFSHSHNNSADRREHLLSYIAFFEDYSRKRGPKEDRWFIRILEDFIFHCMESLLIEKPEPLSLEEVEGDTLERALDYIDTNLSRRLTAEEIARNINTSRRNLYRLFHEKMHRPVHDYIKECKVSLAKNYLDMNCSVSETALLTGYEDLPRFSTLFKAYTGVSPREYKKKQGLLRTGYGRRIT